ncbi:MAG: hypothetical protein AB7N76_20385 [Planctomycetota bacterium]
MAERRAYTADCSGFHLEAQECPECQPGDAWAPALVGGALAWGLALLSGVGAPGRVLAATLGAGAGALASRFHLNLDWDPDRLHPRRRRPPADDRPPAEARPEREEPR